MTLRCVTICALPPTFDRAILGVLLALDCGAIQAMLGRLSTFTIRGVGKKISVSFVVGSLLPGDNGPRPAAAFFFFFSQLAKLRLFTRLFH